VTHSPAGHFQTTYRGDSVRRKTLFQKARLVTLIFILAAFPLVAPTYYVNVAAAVALAVPGALALSMLTGVAGQISLGNAAFMGIGATTAAILSQKLQWTFVPSVAAAGVLTGVIGAAVGIPSLRVRGLYLIIATLALQFVIVFGIQRVQSALVGAGGFVLPEAFLGPISLTGPRVWYFVLVVVAGCVTLMHVNIVRSRIGRAWLAIRERDMAAEILGVSVARYKITAFVATSAIIGVQGALLAYFVGAVSYDMFTLGLALSYIAMVIIGGLGSHIGAIYGAAFVTALPYALSKLFLLMPVAVADRLNQSAFDIQAGIYGVLVILVLVLEPKGLAEITRRIREYFVLWPFSRARLAEEE
jgi:branched-chain amino acid transport system permease protein